MALSAGLPINGKMHRRRSSKDEDEDVLTSPGSQSPPATAPLAQTFSLDDPPPRENGGFVPPSSRSRVTSTPPAITVSQSFPSHPASAGPYRTTFGAPRPPSLNGTSPSFGHANGRHQPPAMRQSFSLPASNSHSRTRSVSGPFSPITPSPLSASFPAQQLAMPSVNKMSASQTAPELNSPVDNTAKAVPPRRHSRIHSRNLSVYFPRPGSLPATTIAEDGAQELDFSGPPSDEGVPIPSASPGPGQRTFREGFTFGARPPSSASPMSPAMPSSAGASRRGHHHKHSLSHNFFSFLEPGVQANPADLHTQPTPVPVSPWAPISPFPSSQSMSSVDSEKVAANGRSMTASKPRAKSPIGRIRASTETSPIAVGAAIWQFVLGAWLWITGQQVGSLSCTGLGYWVVFDAFGVALGQVLPSYLASASMRAETRRPYGCVHIMSCSARYVS